MDFVQSESLKPKYPAPWASGLATEVIDTVRLLLSK
jgi:hypothetical protein